MVLWRSGYHYQASSFNKTWTQVLRKSCSQSVRDLQWKRSLPMVPAGNIPQNQLITIIITVSTQRKLFKIIRDNSSLGRVATVLVEQLPGISRCFPGIFPSFSRCKIWIMWNVNWAVNKWDSWASAKMK